MIIHKTDSDENKHIYFLIKRKKNCVKHVEILERVNNIIKNKFTSELIYSNEKAQKETSSVYMHQ